MSIKKILVIDDSRSDREVLNEILSRHGYRVITAADGAAGIALARSEFPDLILMDVVMPGVNGFEATRTLSRDPATRHIPIVICSGKQQETDRLWGLRQGAHAYLVKPVEEAQLLDTIAAFGKAVPV